MINGKGIFCIRAKKPKNNYFPLDAGWQVGDPSCFPGGVSRDAGIYQEIINGRLLNPTVRNRPLIISLFVHCKVFRSVYAETDMKHYAAELHHYFIFMKKARGLYPALLKFRLSTLISENIQKFLQEVFHESGLSPLHRGQPRS